MGNHSVTMLKEAVKMERNRSELQNPALSNSAGINNDVGINNNPQTANSTAAVSTTGKSYSSKLVKGVVVGAVVGGCITLLDNKTRSSVKRRAVTLKDSSANMINQVKENPQETKEKMVQQMKNASNLLKDAINDAKHLYERVNEDFFKQAEDVKSVTHDAKSTVEDAKSDLQQIGEKVKDATSEISKDKMTPDEKPESERERTYQSIH